MPSLFTRFYQRSVLALRAQRHSRFLWAVVAFTSGIALYFGLGDEPPLGLLAVVVLALLNGAVIIRHYRRRLLVTLLLGVACIAFGCFWAAWHTARHPVVTMEKSLSPREVSGVIEAIEYLPMGQRLTLDEVRIHGIDPERTPQRVRLSLRLKKIPELAVGARVSLKAGLLPPMGPILAGGFDFSRYFYFRGIGAVGYGLGTITVLQEPTLSGFWQFWEQARYRLSTRIRAALPPEHAAIATGLITGDDSAITQENYDILKAANLLHIIAISGSHMVVIAGVVFVSLRLLLLAVPGFGLSVRAKQLAAAITMVAITAYLCVTGVEISALRAYIMMMLLLLAVLVARSMQPVRALMITALIMLLYDPSDLFEPGFQLSFAATLAMVAIAQTALLRDDARRGASLLSRWVYALPYLALISLVAEWVTAPLVMHMFNQFSVYGTLANMVAGPVVSLIIMPAVAMFFVLLPVGGEGLALVVLNAGIGLLMDVARMVAHWPGALHYVPSQPAWAMAVYALALAWVCLWHGRARWLALPVMLAATLTFTTVRMPDMVVSQDMRHVVLRVNDLPTLASGRNYAMVPEMLAHAMGQEKLTYTPPSDAWQCTGKARTRRCVWQAAHQRVFFDFTWDKSGSVCEEARAANADMLITDAYGVHCKGLRQIGPYDRRRNGAYSWWFDDKKMRTTRELQGTRPWSTLTRD